MILLIDNYDSFTWNLVQRLGELDRSLAIGRDLLVVRNDRITPDEALALDAGRGPSHVIISPGPCSPTEAGVSGDIIRAFEGRVPVLGVCLGHQCMAANSGMTVARAPRPMHGKTSPVHHDNRGVFAGLSQPFTATRYHSLCVLPETIPPPPARDAGGRPLADGWEVSAWTDEPRDPERPEAGTQRRAQRVVMGLRRVFADPAKSPVEGVQFHPESFLTDEGPQLLANFLRMGQRPASPSLEFFSRRAG
jgi:anthranilate synthase/aminodeoxychorismate synthase-like glutamine amidotransferase